MIFARRKLRIWRGVLFTFATSTGVKSKYVNWLSFVQIGLDLRKRKSSPSIDEINFVDSSIKSILKESRRLIDHRLLSRYSSRIKSLQINISASSNRIKKSKAPEVTSGSNDSPSAITNPGNSKFLSI